MTELRKAAAWLAMLLAVVALGDRALSAILRQPLTRSGFRFSSALRGGIDADVIAIGDSRGVTSINVPEVERVSGRRVFTLAYNGMNTTAAEALLADYLDRNRPPRLAVVEVTSAVELPTFVSELRTYADLSPRLAALYAAEHPVAARVGTLFTLLHFNSEIYLRALYYLRRSDQDWANVGAMTPADAARSGTIGPWNLQPRPENVAALERIISLLESHGVEVRLLIGPAFPEYAARSKVNAFAAFLAERTRRRVWNYAFAVPGVSNYADVIHLNATGAAQLARIMQRDGFFKDRP